MILRPYQQDLYDRVNRAWAEGYRVPFAVLPTGGGKTVLFSKCLTDFPGVSLAIAHRQELISQMSLTLAKRGVEHDVIGQKNQIKYIASLHTIETGRPWVKSGARTIAVGIDTLNARADKLKSLFNKVGFFVVDEGHHVLKDNKWGRAVNQFPKARGLLVSATPERADGKGLGSHSQGVADIIVVGPSGYDLIQQGYLCDYRIFAPPGVDASNIEIGSTGDYKKNQLIPFMEENSIVGDIVSHYEKIAPGKLGVTFAVDIKNATTIAAAFNQKGVPAEIVTAKTKDALRHEIISRFRRGDIKQLINVDIFGEGFDLPALEVVSMGRPTASRNLYTQQFGRVLRPMEGKDKGIIIDHVGNVVKHGLPDTPREWSLDGRKSNVSERVPQIRVCPACTQVYQSFRKTCPWCEFTVVPETRTDIKHVEGDLTELSIDTIRMLRKEINRIDADPEEVFNKLKRAGAPAAAQFGARANHVERQKAQDQLRYSIAMWAAYRRLNGFPDHESYRVFYQNHGLDVLTAQSLGKRDAEELTEKIKKDVQNMGGFI